MKKLSLLLALCLMLSILTGCDRKPAETTLPTQTTAPVETTTAPTTLPTETTVPPTEPPAVVIDFDMVLPEGFEAIVVEDALTVYASPNAPMDNSTISVEKLAMNEAALTMSEGEFEALFELAPEETAPTETTEPEETEEPTETTEPAETAEPQPQLPTAFCLYSMTQMEIDGWPALYCDYTLTYETYIAHCYRFEVVVNYNNYVFTFTDTTDTNVWLDAYEACIPEIDLILDVEGIELDYSGLVKYDIPGGVTIFAEDGMESHKAEGFTGCIGSRSVIILFMADNKESNNLTEMDLEGYADLLCQTNELSNFKWDTYGNLSTSFYSTDETGMEYYNVITVKETSDAFWVVQMACSADNQAQYARPFSLWASSVMEK